MLTVFLTQLGLLAQVVQVQAFPSLFAEELGCTEILPKKGYGGHKDPHARDSITFMLKEGDKPVTEWVPGKTYTLSTGDGNIEDEVNVWMHVTSGKLQGGTGAQAQCQNGWYSYRPATTQTMDWTSPDDKSCVVFSAAQASDSDAAYQTNTMEMCASGYSEADALKKDISSQDHTRGPRPKMSGTMLMVIFMVVVVAGIVAQYAYRVMANKNPYHLVN